MRIIEERNVVLITIITAFALAIALRPAGASSTRPGAKDRLIHTEVSIPSAPVAPVAADEPSRLRATEAYGKLPLSFEVNEGQTDRRVKFLSRGSGYSLFITSTEAVLSLHRSGPGETTGRGDKER